MPCWAASRWVIPQHVGQAQVVPEAFLEGTRLLLEGGGGVNMGPRLQGIVLHRV